MIILIQEQNSKKVYSKSWCFAHSMLSCIPSWDLCKCVEGHFFLVYSACLNFFHLNFPLHGIYFFVLRTPPPPPNTPITFIMVRPLRLHRARPFVAHCKKDVLEWLRVPRWNFAIISIVTQKKNKKNVSALPMCWLFFINLLLQKFVVQAQFYAHF